MAYSAVTDFVDGDVLSAAKLNGLVSNQEHFQTSVLCTSGIAFVALDTALDAIYGPWLFRRSRRYLHYYIEVLTGDVDRLKINVNGNEEFNDGVNRTSGYIYQSYIDLTLITAVPAIDDFYFCDVDVEHLSPSGGTCRIWYFIESDSTTL